jgi:hypothetical protein
MKATLNDKHFKTFAQFVGILPLEKTYPWLANSLTRYDKNFEGGDKYIQAKKLTWELEI